LLPYFVGSNHTNPLHRPSGAEVLERYLKEVERHAEGSFKKIKGFRYLTQDKPRGTMLHHGFIEGLKWLGRKGYTFDVGVDQHRGGKWQLEEAVKMIEMAHEEVDEKYKVTFIISEFPLIISRR
jgi:L-rhamnono-1,4-lactonase